MKLSDPDKNLRIRYWNCGENQNNAVVPDQGGRARSSEDSRSTKELTTSRESKP